MKPTEYKEAVEYAKAVVEAPSRSMAKRIAIIREDSLAKALLAADKVVQAARQHIDDRDGNWGEIKQSLEEVGG